MSWLIRNEMTAVIIVMIAIWQETKKILVASWYLIIFYIDYHVC
jgi:hypothetical protein